MDLLLQKKRINPIRDSQARLEKVGKPGSKRFQRFVNKTYLYQHEWDLQPEDFEIAKKSPSPFSLLFDEKIKQLWEPFIDITEEEQEKLLQKLSSTSFRQEEQEDEFGDFVILPSSSENEFVFIEEEEKKKSSNL